MVIRKFPQAELLGLCLQGFYIDTFSYIEIPKGGKGQCDMED
jgi:hypothetical protein